MPNTFADLYLASVTQQSSRNVASSNTERILIVEDDDDIRDVIAIRMQSAGFTTAEARDGIEGLTVALQKQLAAIILDIRLPEQSGLTLLKKLKSNAITRSIPVIVVSASVGDREPALDCGAAFFIEKPFGSRELITAVATAIAESKSLGPLTRVDAMHVAPTRSHRTIG
ncbi:MAG: response regulator [Planctomycetota bacterium]